MLLARHRIARIREREAAQELEEAKREAAIRASAEAQVAAEQSKREAAIRASAEAQVAAEFSTQLKPSKAKYLKE